VPAPSAAPAQAKKSLFIDEAAEDQGLSLDIDSALVADWLQEGRPLLFVDVRELQEMREAHLEGALLLPMGQVAARLSEIPRDRTVVTYCMSGGRSHQVTALLRQRGLEDVWSMVGGIGSWLAQGGKQVIPAEHPTLRLAEPARLTQAAAQRLGVEGELRGTVQEMRADEAGALRLALWLPRGEGASLRLTDLSPDDLEPA
jgi:rhodanese-related sulfurtransferase